MRNANVLGRCSVLMLLVSCTIASGQEPAKRDAKVGQFRITLPATWAAPKQDSKAPIVAVRRNKEGTKQIGANGEVLLGKPTVFTKDNIDQFKF